MQDGSSKPRGKKNPRFCKRYTAQKQLQVKEDGFGLYKFADWLPVKRLLNGSSSPVTYKSEKLAAYLGLENLYITFSGWWPEKGAAMKTCSFKETEAYSVCARLKENSDKILVVASAGNTARSFARVCSDNDIPLLLCIPEDNLDALWFDEKINRLCQGSLPHAREVIILMPYICRTWSVNWRNSFRKAALKMLPAVMAWQQQFFQQLPP